MGRNSRKKKKTLFNIEQKLLLFIEIKGRGIKRKKIGQTSVS